MPKIPLLEEQVRVQAPSPAGFRPSVAPTPEAFGVGVARAAAEQGETISRAGEVLAQHALRMRQREADKEVLRNLTAFEKEMQDGLYNTEADEEGRPKGFLSRQLGHARGATVEFDRTYATIKEKYLGAAGGSYQREKILAAMENQYSAMRGGVIRHEASQGEADFSNALKANIEQSVSFAGSIQDPKGLGLAISTAQSAVDDGYRHLGYDPKTLGAAKSRLAGQMVEASFVSVLDRNPAAARVIFEAHKAAIPGDVATKLQSALDGKEFDDLRLGVWGQVSGSEFRRSDGTYDEGKQREAVFAIEAIPTDKKERIFDYVRARAGEDRQNTNMSRASTDRDFFNELHSIRKDGARMDEALRLAGKYGFDAYDAGIKERAIRELYSAPKQTDPETYISLWEGVQGKMVSQRDIDGALLGGKLSPQDWEQLRKESWRMQTEGVTPAEKDMRDRVKLLAEQKFGSQKEKRDSFLLAAERAGRGKAVEEQWKIANDMLKDVDVPYSWFNAPAYEAEIRRADAESLAWAEIYGTVGRDVVQAIGSGLLQSGREAWGLSDVSAFAEPFGGPEGLKEGTPAGNAVRSLIRRGVPVVRENVEFLLEKYPDGNY